MPASCRRFLPLCLALFSAPLAALDGELDPTWSLDGIVAWTNGGSVELADVTTDQDHAVAVGTYTAGPGAAPTLHWQMLDAQGTLLANLNCYLPTGTLFPLSTESHASAALLDRQGRLVVGGWAAFAGTPAVRRALVARFDLSQPGGCVLDTTFADSGWRQFDAVPFCDTESCEILDLVELPPVSGLPRSLVLLLRARVNAFVSRHFLVALEDDGDVDTTWVGDGYSEMTLPDLGTLHPEASITYVADEFPGGDINRIVFAGTRYDPDEPTNLDAVLLRCRSNGLLDQQFIILDRIPGEDHTGVASARTREDVQFTGEQLLGAGFEVQAFDDIDEVFIGLGSSVLRDLVAVEGDGGRAVTVADRDPEDAVVVHRTRPDFVAGTLVLDPEFGPSGSGWTVLEIDMGGDDVEVAAAVALMGGRVLVAGTGSTATGTAGFLVRLTDDQIFRDGFADGTLLAWSRALR
jgi:hypothetical protein